MYIVYKHTNKTNGKIYIGITCQTPEQRWRSGLGDKDQSKFYNAILKYSWNGFLHEIIFSNLSQKQAYELEEKLIKQYDSIDNGYNIQIGGEDIGIWAKANLSKRIYQLDPVDYHVIREYESIADASDKHNIASTSIAQAIRRSGTSVGYYWCIADNFLDWKPRSNLNEQSIYKIDRKTFKILKKYDSIVSASQENNISCSGLYRCDEFFSLGGFCWCKCNEWYEGWKPSRKPNTATPVYQIEQNTLRVINEWESIKEASQVLGINKNVIVRCCKRKGIIAGGFHWCKIEKWTSDWVPKKKVPLIGRRKALYQIDKKSLKIVAKYESLFEASSAVGVPISCIAKAASGNATESAGYYWCYVNIYKGWKPKIKKKTGIMGKKVCQCDLDGNVLKVWDSIKEASEYAGISASNISNVCAGRNKSAAGYKWKYK